MFDGARPCVVDGPEGPVSFLAPDDGHAFLLAATNAAKDKFGPYATIKLLDGWRLRRRLTRAQSSDVVARARRGGSRYSTACWTAWPGPPARTMTGCRGRV